MMVPRGIKFPLEPILFCLSSIDLTLLISNESVISYIRETFKYLVITEIMMFRLLRICIFITICLFLILSCNKSARSKGL